MIPKPPAPSPEQFLGSYGTAWKTGLLSEHVDAFMRAGGQIRNAASGSGLVWAIIERKAYPVVCSDVIEIATEDGPVSGRCGLRAVRQGACEAHAAEHAAWLAASEAERAAWERDREGLAR